MSATPRRIVSAVCFSGFEVLDLFGPIEVLEASGRFEVRVVGPDHGAVRSAQGPAVACDLAYGDAPEPDLVLVPGGIGTRELVVDAAWLSWLRTWANAAPVVASVCTGSGLLAAAGLLDGYRATSNKAAFGWARSMGPRTEWVEVARFVHDRDRWTSSGVTAGMDMALALVAELEGTELAEETADRIELEWHRDPDWDPFALRYGLGGT